MCPPLTRDDPVRVGGGAANNVSYLPVGKIRLRPERLDPCDIGVCQARPAVSIPSKQGSVPNLVCLVLSVCGPSKIAKCGIPSIAIPMRRFMGRRWRLTNEGEQNSDVNLHLLFTAILTKVNRWIAVLDVRF
jgi:hypothetical protein